MLTRKNLVLFFHFLCRLSLVAPFWPTLVLLLASSTVPFSSIVSMRHSHSLSVEWGSKAAVSRPARGETDCFFFEQTIVNGALRIGTCFFKNRRGAGTTGRGLFPRFLAPSCAKIPVSSHALIA